jgi:mycofactocin precursor
MPETTTAPDVAATALDDQVPAPAAEEALVEESLVEEVSIDGMGGVY